MYVELKYLMNIKKVTVLSKNNRELKKKMKNQFNIVLNISTDLK